MDELFARVTKGLKDCIQSIEDAECPDDCPYNGKCWGETPEHQVNPLYLDLLKDAQDLIRQQEMELIRLRDQAQCVELKSAWNLQRFKYKQENTNDVERSEFIRAHLMNDLIQACEKMGLIAYERSQTEVGGSGPMVSITATLRVHKPEAVNRE